MNAASYLLARETGTQPHVPAECLRCVLEVRYFPTIEHKIKLLREKWRDRYLNPQWLHLRCCLDPQLDAHLLYLIHIDEGMVNLPDEDGFAPPSYRGPSGVFIQKFSTCMIDPRPNIRKNAILTPEIKGFIVLLNTRLAEILKNPELRDESGLVVYKSTFPFVGKEEIKHLPANETEGYTYEISPATRGALMMTEQLAKGKIF
jgi:hypothetical protein